MDDDARDSRDDHDHDHAHHTDPADHHDHTDEPRVEQSLLEDEVQPHHARRDVATEHDHDGMHAGHEEMFRRRFFVSTLLSIPVLLYSETLQTWLGFTVPTFPGSGWVSPVFAVVVFAYGGVPFLRMAVPELRDRSPGMMTLVSMAITVAFTYSLATVLVPGSMGFFWELVTLIDVMLLGHWIEMRSVRRASSALDELAKLLPDTAERIVDGDETEEVPVATSRRATWCSSAPGRTCPRTARSRRATRPSTSR